MKQFAVAHFSSLAFGCAAIISLAAGMVFSAAVESRIVRSASAAIAESGEDWAAISSDGNLVELTGTAPTAGRRLAAIAAIAEAAGHDRIVDRTSLASDAPRLNLGYSFRLLQRDNQAILSGRFPDAESRDGLLRAVANALPSLRISDHSTIHPSQRPSYWIAAIEFASEALRLGPGADLFYDGDLFKVAFLAESEGHRLQAASVLDRIKPDNIALEVSAPSPLPFLAPFAMELTASNGSAQLIRCHAETSADRDRIIDAVQGAGHAGIPECKLGLGAPDSNWADNVIQAIQAAVSLGNASVAATGTDIVLTGGSGVSLGDLQRASEAMAGRIKGAYSLRIALPEQDAADPPKVEYSAAKDGNRKVTLQGNLKNESEGKYIARYARALFKTSEVEQQDDFSSEVPAGWTDRVILGLKALEMLDEGSLTLSNDQGTLSGTTRDIDRKNAALSLIANASRPFVSEIEYIVPELTLELPQSPEQCIALVYEELEESKILFSPGSDRLLASTFATLSNLSRILAECPHAQIEIGGHTDSQGREEMNKSLSLKRARAVIYELSLRGAPVGNLSAAGYGEANPIADNATAEGRDINRRIEFRLLPQPSVGQPR